MLVGLQQFGICVSRTLIHQFEISTSFVDQKVVYAYFVCVCHDVYIPT